MNLKYMKRYKEGFDRLGVVIFVAAAIAVAGTFFSVNDRYTPPDPATPAGERLAAEIAFECRDAKDEIMGTLCEEGAMSKRYWQHFGEQYQSGNTSSAVHVITIILVMALAVASYKWVIAGFRMRRAEAVTNKQKIIRIFEDYFYGGGMLNLTSFDPMKNYKPNAPEKNKTPEDKAAQEKDGQKPGEKS